MEMSDLVSARKFRELKAEQKEELYETLLQLIEVVDEIPKKSLRKTLDVTLAVLQWKGMQVGALQSQLASKDSSEDDSQMERLMDENDKLKVMLERLEDEKSSLKHKVKELTEDIFQLQRRLQEAAQTAAAEGSDKDSSDPLSELDKQEELLRNINTKNKHIKRLLREIESLQNQNIAQSKTIIECETELQQQKTKLLQLSADITLVDSERKALKETVNELNLEITRLESNITYLEEEREKSEHELKEFIEKLEVKAHAWKSMLDDKDKELKKLRARLEKAGAGTVSLEEDTDSHTEDGSVDKQAEDMLQETTKLLHALETRDKHIESLECKIKSMAEEMISSTKLMNQLSAEQEEARNPQKTRVCCKTIEDALHASNERCRELSEMLARTEEDNALKSKQALQAIAALDAYQRGEDGLVKALRKCSALEQKVMSRDKQIRALIMELNSMHEIAHENGILRKRLNIPDDMVISAKNLVAKERNKEKMIERLTLKLRASEEMRLQLKLEKSDLRKELLELQQKSPRAITHNGNGDKGALDSLQLPSEIGEVEESTRVSSTETNEAKAFCINCKLALDIPDEGNQAATEKEVKYQDVLEENDTLRAGMLEILEKLREYDACSDHITIDTEMLYRLLEALRTRSAPSSPKRLQAELQSLQAREEALRALLLKQSERQESQETDELSSVESMREDGEMRKQDEELLLQLPNIVDTSTRPTTPNKSLNQSSIPVIADDTPTAPPDSAQATLRIRALQHELEEQQIYRKHYEALHAQLNASATDVTRQCAALSAQTLELELTLSQQRSSYAYMREDYDRTLSAAKESELRHIEQTAQLTQQLHSAQHQLETLQQSTALQLSAGRYSSDEYLQLQQSNAELRAQLAHISEQLLSGKLDAALPLPDICTDYGVIQDNLQLDYVTAQEYEQLRAELQDSRATYGESARKCVQLERLLEVAQAQIQSQQKLLNEITDNHVSLRHLVADLQSSAEDKLLLAKMQRDLDSAKQELSNLRYESDELKQKFATSERELSAKEQFCAQLNKDFQFERINKDIKIKFLQKSLFVLREKYAKFTPLIFLTNFVFAYTKFAKKSLQASSNESDVQGRIMADVTALIQGKLQEQHVALDESQQLIKLIKTETQCKLLEENLGNLQKRYDLVQEELLEQRVRYATESEHWQMIDALFRTDANKTNQCDAATEKVDAQHKDVGTNTEAPPVPAERKLSTATATRRKSLAEMIDKGLSPIGSPVRRTPKVDAATQANISPEITSRPTEESDAKEAQQTAAASLEKAADADEMTQSAAEAVTQPPKVVPRNEKMVQVNVREATAEAVVQTSAEALMTSQSVQTESEEEQLGVTEVQSAPSNAPTELELQTHALKQRADERETLLKQCQLELQTAQARIVELQQELESVSKTEIATQVISTTPAEVDTHSKAPAASEAELNQKSDIIEKTILSFHTLLSEKDKSISKYQDLLQTEREQCQTTITKLHTEIDGLKNTVTNLNYNIKTKDMEILELKTQLEVCSVRRNSNEKLDLAAGTAGVDDNVDNSLHELTDEKIEEMFQQDAAKTPSAAASMVTPPATTTPQTLNEQHVEKQEMETLKELPLMQQQLKELRSKVRYCEKTLRVKDDELTLLKEKLQLYQEREKTLECAVNPEIEQMRLLLEEKEKHINELTETLNNFHDDQQRYIKDSSSCTADQISKLHADLTRTEATNKIYHTQVEALRRQVASLTQREKQARELNQSLRNQLIKRPVVSIKTELNARVKNENLQKRIQTLELDLEDSRAQIQRQQIMLDTKRAKSASEVGLWEKQKRWQQNAERFKAKYEETETALEKTRALLQSARTMNSRLEKDKQVLEAKLSRAVHGGGGVGAVGSIGAHNMKCCRTPSCPNLQHSCGKYTPSESPETYTGASSECSSPAHSLNGCRHGGHMQAHYYGTAAGAGVGALEKQQPHGELIEALKARIELQQRKILAMELEGKGTNALTTEMEKLQEKLSEIEAQNIRLEAKNLQLQLDNDMLRQGDASERLHKRIKYLEDYIIALKEEMAQAEARRELCKCSGIKINTQLGQSAEQTILSLRGIVEKLRAENKFLKDGRRSYESRSTADTSSAELNKLHKLYAESLDKISALQIELNVKAKCRTCGKQAETHINDELSFIKEQLNKKTQLLQKAKVLLTRAAAKEKVLKEQLSLWKRKCSELQNVPVIDEISE